MPTDAAIADDPVATQTLRVLVVDDNELTLRALSEKVADRPEVQAVYHAGSGTEALLLADRHVPDVVLLDVSLGDLSGLAVTRHLKRRPVPPYVAVVSVHDELAYVEAALDAGADAYVPKGDFNARLSGLIAAAIAYVEARGPGS